MTAFAYVGTAADESHNASGSSLTLPVPTGTLDGDLMFLYFMVDTTSAPATSAGWTSLATIGLDGGPTRQARVWYRVASSEPADYTITFGALSSACLGAITTYRGVTLGTPATRTSVADHNDAGGVKHDDLDLALGSTAQTAGFIFYIAGLRASYKTTAGDPTTVDAACTERATCQQYSGSGTLYQGFFSISDQVIPTSAGEPAVAFDSDYTDTFHSGCRAFLFEFSGYTATEDTSGDAWSWAD